MKRKTSTLFLMFATFLVIPSFLQPPVFSGIDEKFDKAWQHLAVKHQFAELLGPEEAIVWHLDYNGFAVRLPDCLMVFDYDNETPAPQHDKKPETGIVESLLTGVINPEEIKDERVIFFFSHEHPAEKILKLLSWKDQIKDVLFVMPEEVYLKYEDKIKEFQEKDSADLNKKSVLSVIKPIKPDHTYTFRGSVVVTPRQRAVLGPGNKTLYPGVEFIVQTTNGLTIYHSGSLMCRRCSDLKAILGKHDEELARLPGIQRRVISADTQKMRFVDGKMVAVGSGKEAVDRGNGTAGLQRLGLAVYSSPQNATGDMLMSVTVGPEPDGIIGLIGAGGIRPGGPEADAARRAREKDYLLETDKFLTDRNPNFQADLGDAARLEHEINKINEYFDRMAGNPDVLLTLKNTASRRYARYHAEVKEYCGPEVTPEECDKKTKARLHGGSIFNVSYDDPSGWRGASYLFTTSDESVSGSAIDSRGDFSGYFTSEGYPLFNSNSFLYKIFKERGN